MNNVQQIAVFNALTNKVGKLHHELDILERRSVCKQVDNRTLSGMEKTCLHLDAEISRLTGEIEALKQSQSSVLAILAKKHSVDV